MKVVLENVTKAFGDTTVVKDFSVTLPDGHLTALLGPSGCGKSTILNMLSGILPVTAGRVLFDGEDVTALPSDRRGIGMVFQNYSLYPHMTAAENIGFPLEIRHVKKKERTERVAQIARLVHVEKYLKRYPSEMSGGQQQRVAIARAIIKQPRLLLMDEPLSNLDARLRLELREEIRRVQQETKVTTVFVTHDQDEAMSISDDVILMKAGVLQQNGTPQELYDDPANRFVADFLGNPQIGKIDGVWHGGAFCLPDGSQRLPFAASIEDGRKVTLALRAESVRTAAPEDDGFTALVDRVYTLGKEDIAYLRIGDATVRAFFDTENVPKAGDTLRVRLRKRGAFLFDTATGERLL